MLTFFCVLPGGKEVKLDTFNLEEAPRLAKKLGAIKLWGINPWTSKKFTLGIAV